MESIKDGVKRWARWAWISVQIKWLVLRKLVSSTIITVGFLFVVYSALVNTVYPSGFGFVDDTNRPFWTLLGSVSALVLVLIKPLWDWLKGDGYLRHVPVSDPDKTDMKQMAKFMKKAEDVTIYSGDFSYIYDHEPLYKILLDLAMRDNLTFISYKSKELVTVRSENKRGDKDCIITALVAAKKIFFDLPGKAKFSLIEKRGEEILLYKHSENGVDHVTIFRAANGMSKQLVETIKTLVGVATKNSS